MNAAVPRWRISEGASLKSSAGRQGFPAMRPVTGTFSGHGPDRSAAADSRLTIVNRLTCPNDALVMPATYWWARPTLPFRWVEGSGAPLSIRGRRYASRAACPAAGGGAGSRDEALPFGPGGQDVPGQVLGHPHRPDEERPYGLLCQGLGCVLPAAAACGRQVAVDAQFLPGRFPDARRAGAELVKRPKPGQRGQGQRLRLLGLAGQRRDAAHPGGPVRGLVRARTWSAHTTSGLYWGNLRRFCEFLSYLEVPVTGIDEITPGVIKRWRLNQPDTLTGRNAITYISRLLKGDARLNAGPVAEELARRGKPARSRLQSYPEAEFSQITTAARRMFRAALLRIEENAAHLQRFRDGQFAAGSRDFVIGEALECLARTGDLPKYDAPVGAGKVVARYARALGGTRAEVAWQRLFLSRREAVALAVLLLAEYGWNLSVINRQQVPRAAPDPGGDGRRTYRILLEKRRRGKGHWFETRNVTDDGAASNGRPITQALAATRFARAIVEELAPRTDLLIVWRTNSIGRYQQDQDRPPPVGQFRFGVQSHDAAGWTRGCGLAGSPFQRGRRTVVAVDRREPTQHSQDTHDRHYALADHRVQAGAVPVIAAGAQEAADRAPPGGAGRAVAPGTGVPATRRPRPPTAPAPATPRSPTATAAAPRPS
jgi:hypothetical protein